MGMQSHSPFGNFVGILFRYLSVRKAEKRTGISIVNRVVVDVETVND